MPPSSRIHQALNRVEQLNQMKAVVNASKEELEFGREALRTLWEFFFIGYTWRERGKSRGPYTGSRLAAILSGAEAPALDKNALARSIQFELYVASAFILGGADVIDGEPDIRMLYFGSYRGLAIKRVIALTGNAMKRAVRDAAQQIRHSTGSGFIAINLDSRMNGLRTGGNAQELGTSFDALLEDAHRVLGNEALRESILGYILYGTWFDWNFSEGVPRLEFHMPNQVRCLASSNEDQDRSRRFFNPLRERLGNAIIDMARLVGSSLS